MADWARPYLTAPQHGQDDFRVGLAHGLVKVRVINTNHLTNEL